MEQAYLNVLFARPPRVLGRELLPFSAAHAYTLLAVESPYLTGAAEPAFTDAVMVAWVCSQPCWPLESVRDMLEDRSAVKAAGKWARKVSESDMAAAMETIAEYLGHALKMPERKVDPKKVRKSSVPWPLTIAVSLMRHGHSERDAWTMPMSRAVAYKLTHDYIDGDDSLSPPPKGVAQVKKKDPAPDD